MPRLARAGAALGVLVHLVPVRPAERLGHLGIRVSVVEDVVLEVAADRDVAERDVRDRSQDVDGELRLGDGVVHELKIRSDLHQVRPVGATA